MYEMILVRHGLMLVGLPFSGKTKCYHALGGALGLVHEKVKYKINHGILRPLKITPNKKILTTLGPWPI